MLMISDFVLGMIFFGNFGDQTVIDLFHEAQA